MADTLQELERDLEERRKRSVAVREAYRKALRQAKAAGPPPPDLAPVLEAETAAAEAWARVEEFKAYGHTVTPKPK